MSRPTKKHENLLYAKGFKYIAGVDEVGCGSLAGPVVAAAVIFPPNFFHKSINDSKLLLPAQREKLCRIIEQAALAVGIGIVDAEAIDKINIAKATHLAMWQALESLTLKPDFAILDGRDRLMIPLPHKAVISGDSLCFCIAAASIVAKVTRDQMMSQQLHKQYPQYRFDLHKGYGTALHYQNISKHGPCPIHRQSFVLAHPGPQSKIPLDIQSVSS